MDSKFLLFPLVFICYSYKERFCQEMLPVRVQCKHRQKSSTEGRCPQYFLLPSSGTLCISTDLFQQITFFFFSFFWCSTCLVCVTTEGNKWTNSYPYHRRIVLAEKKFSHLLEKCFCPTMDQLGWQGSIQQKLYGYDHFKFKEQVPGLEKTSEEEKWQLQNLD